VAGWQSATSGLSKLERLEQKVLVGGARAEPGSKQQHQQQAEAFLDSSTYQHRTLLHLQLC